MFAGLTGASAAFEYAAGMVGCEEWARRVKPVEDGRVIRREADRK